MRRSSLLFFFSLFACSATDFSKQGASATDGGVAVGPDGGVIVDDGGEGRDSGNGGPIDCAKIQPTPTYCTTFPTSTRPAEYDRWGTTDFTVSSTRAASPDFALAFTLTGPSSDTGTLNNSNSAHLGRSGDPTTEVVLEESLFIDVPNLTGRGSAIVWDMVIGGVELAIDFGASGAYLKGPPNATVLHTQASGLPLGRWFRVRAKVSGSPRVLDLQVDGAAWVNALPINANVAGTGVEFVLGLKYVTGLAASASWSMYADDVVLWAR